MDTILILDFGSQVTQLIARRIRSFNVHAEIAPYNVGIDRIDKPEIKGVILSGGPASVFGENAALPDKQIFELGKPILGICYGIQVLAHMLGGAVARGVKREYGATSIKRKAKSEKLFGETPKEQTVWMSHFDIVSKPPVGFSSLAASVISPFAAIADPKRNFYGVQFHLEVSHTPYGTQILKNFALKICKAKQEWTPRHLITDAIEKIWREVGSRSVVHALSGCVDSTVLAILLKKSNVKVKNIFVDNGLLRLNEAAQVMAYLKKLGLEVERIDASKQFLDSLREITDPEQKRKIIGRVFIEILMANVGKDDMLSQGTLYPDVIESTKVHGPSDKIKTHHNRAPEVLELMRTGRVIEPFKELFKDEVRAIGTELELPDEIVWRHPFPGPGLAIGILGDVTEERLDMLRQADEIFMEEIKKAKLYRKISEAFAALDTSRAVGVKGDEREYGYMILLRAITTDDFMTADWYPFSHDFLACVANRIINEVEGVTRVLYDITQKPPGTIRYI